MRYSSKGASMAVCRPDKSLVTVIIKPTFDCNLRCKYCYEGDICNSQRMDTRTLNNIFTKLAEYYGPQKTIRVVWHGGEPLLMGIEFFEKVIKIQKKLGVEYDFRNVVQTNATILTREFLDFFESNNFHIGVSIDGPKELHNAWRQYPDGSGSFDDVMRAVHLIKERKDGCGAVAVLTKLTLSHLDEFYEFFKTEKIHVKVIPLSISGRAEKRKQSLMVSPIEYGNAMIYLFNKWFNEKEYKIGIDPFEDIICNLIIGRPTGECIFQPDCYDNFIVITPNGDVFPCGRWALDAKFMYGNINKQSIDELLNSQTAKRIKRERKLALENCSTCEFKSICNAGCMDYAYMRRHKLSDVDYYCKGYKMLFKHVKLTLLRELKASLKGKVNFNIRKLPLNKLEPESIQNPILRWIFTHRLRIEDENIVGYTEYEKIRYYDWKEKYSRYREVYREEYSKYSRYSRYSYWDTGPC